MTAVTTINGPIDIEITNVSDLAGMDIWGAQTATSFGLQVVDDWAMAFGGTGFGSYSGNRPTTGTITSIEQWGLGSGSPIQRTAWTGFSFSVSDFNAWIASNDVAAMQNAIFGGADTVIGSALGDNLFTYGGDDTITPGGGGDVVNAGAGADIVRSAGMITGDSYEGGDGADTLSVLDGVETNLFGSYYAFASDYTLGDLNSFEALTFAESTASDRIAMFTALQAQTDLASNLQVTGGAGVDIVAVFGDGTIDLSGWQFSNWTPFSVTFDANGDVSFDNDVILISAGAGNDTLTGTSQGDVLQAGAGDDTLYGGDGDDELDGWEGLDSLYGGNGNDALVFSENDISSGEVADGGAGTDTLGIYGTVDARNINLTSLEALRFLGQEIASGVTFNASQFGGSGLANTLAVSGLGSFADQVNVYMTTPGAFSAASWTFSNWSSGDLVRIFGSTGNDMITATSANDQIEGGSGNDTLDGGAGDDALAGGEGVDRLTYVNATSGVTVSLALQGVAQDTLGAGSDTLTSIEEIFGSLHADTLTGDGGDNFLAGNSGNDTLTGGDGNDLLSGEGGSDQVDGGAGNDTLYGGSGTDSVSGGLGDDVFAVGSSDLASGDVLDGGDGSDVLLLSSQNISADFRSATLSSFEGLTFDRTGSNQAIFSTSQLGAGLSASAVIDGGSGTDSVVLYMSASGSLTVDFTFVDWSGSDQIVVYGSGGADAITGSDYRDYLAGADGDDVLEGQGGDDTLVGGIGADAMSGGDGHDTYIVDNAGDAVTEISGQGTDSVQASISYTLSAEVENLTLTGAGSINGTGNVLANTIAGNSGGNALDGAAGADTLNGNDGADTLYGGTGNDTLDGGNHDDQLFGGDNADALYGRAGNDTLDGGAGANTLEGGGGDDTYIVRGASDIVVELSASGTDSIMSTATRTLGNFQENLTLTGVAAINGFGNTLANVMIGNDAINTLNGLAGADSLSGGFGADTLNGGDGNDTLNGGGDNDLLDGGNDADTLNGGDGADTLYGRTANDAINGDAGIDTIFGGDGDDTINGGADNDVIDGNNHNDVLSGGDGDDEMYGRQDNDAVNGDAGNDLLYGGDGDDFVDGGADNDLLDGGNGVDGMNGGDGADTLYGRNGNDVLDGGLGADTLYGGNDADTFVFSTALGGSNVDTVGFSVIENDVIQLDVDIFAAIGLGALAANAFVIGAAASTADHRIIYDTTTGALYYDADGDGLGAAVQFATLGTGLALSNADFVGGP